MLLKKQPHPEVFLKAAKSLGVKPSSCIVFEDAPKGVEAAANAGIECIVVTTMHDAIEFAAYNNVRLFIKDFLDPSAFNSLVYRELGVIWI